VTINLRHINESGNEAMYLILRAVWI